MDEQLNVIQTVQNINACIQNSTTLRFSASRLILIGLCVLAIPFLYLAVPMLLMDLYIYNHQLYRIISLLLPTAESTHWEFQYFVFISAICVLFSFAVFKLFSQELFINAQHPVLRKVTSLHSVALVAAFLTSYALAFAGRFEYIFSTVTLVVGILYYLYGQFSRKLIRIFGSSFLVSGIVSIIGLQFASKNFPYDALAFIPGLAFLALGLLLVGEKISLKRFTSNESR